MNKFWNGAIWEVPTYKSTHFDEKLLSSTQNNKKKDIKRRKIGQAKYLDYPETLLVRMIKKTFSHSL